MFAPARNAAHSYTQIGVETGVASASPHALIVMLFDGALLAISTAGNHMKNKQIGEKGMAISKAIDIINCGLKASLDKTSGGDLAEKLDALYEYMSLRLIHANVKNDQAALDEVSHLLNEIRSAWVEIAETSTSTPDAATPDAAAVA